MLLCVALRNGYEVSLEHSSSEVLRDARGFDSRQHLPFAHMRPDPADPTQ